MQCCAVYGPGRPQDSYNAAFVCPRSTTMWVPVIKLLASEASSKIGPSSSCKRPNRFGGMFCRYLTPASEAKNASVISDAK